MKLKKLYEIEFYFINCSIKKTKVIEFGAPKIIQGL